jgi:putative phosphoesterase
MRLAIVSDIHGNLEALRSVVADIGRRGADAIVNLGDSLSGPLQPRATAQFLMEQPWIQLAGNHERQLLDFDPQRRGPSDVHAHAELDAPIFTWMSSLTHARAIDSDVFACHGTPASDLEYFLERIDSGRVRLAELEQIERNVGSVTASLIVCGHTHVPRVVRLPSGQVIVNPGSIGLPAYDDDRPVPHIIETGSPHARYAMVERRGSEWAVCLLAVAYDHTSAAQQARERGRSDWEHALLTGFMPPVPRA